MKTKDSLVINTIQAVETRVTSDVRGGHCPGLEVLPHKQLFNLPIRENELWRNALNQADRYNTRPLDHNTSPPLTAISHGLNFQLFLIVQKMVTLRKNCIAQQLTQDCL